jgi:hypothetical protein
MLTIDLAYVGRGIHEELVAYVADQEGYYVDEGVHVAIRDGVSWNTERLRHSATIGLGRTLLARLTDGIGWTALSVDTHRPLFWFLGSAKVDLHGGSSRASSSHPRPPHGPRLFRPNCPPQARPGPRSRPSRARH